MDETGINAHSSDCNEYPEAEYRKERIITMQTSSGSSLMGILKKGINNGDQIARQRLTTISSPFFLISTLIVDSLYFIS